MRQIAVAVAAAVLLGLASTAAPASAAALPADTELTARGLGPIRLGMTEREIERASGLRLHQDDWGVGPSCTTASFGHRNYLLFRRGKLARITVASRRFATGGGVRVGDRQRKVRRVYGAKVRRSPHAYTRGASYLDVGRGSPRLRFETNRRGRVTLMHAGLAPEIGYVEACA